jgi:mannose-1-phosphate guanylyltransferase
VIEGGAVIGPLTCLGDRCRVAAGATVEGSVLHEGVEVGANAKVMRSVLGRGVRIGSATQVVDAVVGADVRVGADNELRGGVRLWPGLDVPDAGITFDRYK